ncbi:MAG: response regulator [bacterium]|nr:response regulator [bacterium]
MSSKNHTILLIEDELPIIEVVTNKLEKKGFTVEVARSVNEALKQIQEHSIQFIWLDHYLLGKENGLDFVVKIKQSEIWKHIPIFVVSNTSSPENVQTYLHLGVDKYYTKHVARLDEIVDELKKVLSKE